MKLPKAHDKYQHNAQIEKLYRLAYEVNQPNMACDSHMICAENLANLKKINAIIIHLELAIDEIMRIEK